MVIEKSMFGQAVFKMSAFVHSDGLDGQYLLQFYPRSCGMTSYKQKAKKNVSLGQMAVYKWAS